MSVTVYRKHAQLTGEDGKSCAYYVDHVPKREMLSGGCQAPRILLCTSCVWKSWTVEEAKQVHADKVARQLKQENTATK